MALYLLDLNDHELRIYRDGKVAAESTGYAFIRDSGVIFGDEARRQFRLHPRQANNQHWHRLAMDPLAIRGANLSNLADLVYRHLGELVRSAGIGPADEMFIATPGTVTPDQLGLLLGVAQELRIAVTGLVDSAVASCTEGPLPSRVVHVDLSLHRATATLLEIGGEVVRSSANEVPEAGLSHIVDGWVNVVSHRFVTETRFDPLRIAETEQQVYNQVTDWLTAADKRTELIVETSHRDALRRVTVPVAALIDKASARFRVLSEALPAQPTVVLSQRALRIPGLSERLVADGATLRSLPGDALAKGVVQNVDSVRSNPAELRFVTRLPRTAAHAAVSSSERKIEPPSTTAATRPGQPASVASGDVRLPTHVLYRGRARAINARLLVGHAAFPDTSRSDPLPDRVAVVEHANDGVWVRAAEGSGVSLNGRSMNEAARTRIGDVLRCGPHEFTLIQVVDGQET